MPFFILLNAGDLLNKDILSRNMSIKGVAPVAKKTVLGSRKGATSLDYRGTITSKEIEL